MRDFLEFNLKSGKKVFLREITICAIEEEIETVVIYTIDAKFRVDHTIDEVASKIKKVKQSITY